MNNNYDSIRHEIITGDVCLFRNGGVIEYTGVGAWTHASKCYWYDGVLMTAEMREFRGGQCLTLRSQVRKYQGRIDIFRPTWCNAEITRDATRFAVQQAGHPYSWLAIQKLAVQRMSLVRLLTRHTIDVSDMTLSDWYEPKICSQMVVWVDRMAAKKAGVPVELWPLPKKGDKWITPSDIAFSSDYRQIFSSLVTRNAA